jgi:hypothetical protein
MSLCNVPWRYGHDFKIRRSRNGIVRRYPGTCIGTLYASLNKTPR